MFLENYYYWEKKPAKEYTIVVPPQYMCISKCQGRNFVWHFFETQMKIPDIFYAKNRYGSSINIVSEKKKEKLAKILPFGF